MSPIPDLERPVVHGDAAAALLARAAADVGPDGLPSCALAVLRDGEVVLDAVVGAPRDATHLLWSVSKGLVSALVGVLFDEGRLGPDTPVVEVLPWFTGGGKQDVRVAHLLLHTAGLATAPMRSLEGADPARRRARMQQWHTTTVPGEAFRYHHTSAHWVLRSLVEQVTGTSFEHAWQDRVAGPLGLDTLTFAPDAADPRWQELVDVGQPTPPDVLATLREQGIDVTAMVGEAGHEQLLTFNDPEVLAAGSPGAGAVGQVRDVARLYDALLHDRTGRWSEATRSALTSQVRNQLPDPGLGMAASRTLGFVVAGEDGRAGMRELPTSLGPRVFGQPGVCGQIAWADPDTGTCFAYATNGLHRDPLVWWARVGELNELAAAVALAG